ncbi:MAG: pyridoxal-phosphate dependent enzyme, partial [Deltaproteobacteria bacterium]|nr:pyridoxal-phosphate dependent enzyme [Deltaproteobacteria bacterium]
TPENLGQLVSKIRRDAFNPSERSKLVHAIRRYLNEKGLPNFRLEDPLVAERASRIWRNERSKEGLSANAQAALGEIEAARKVLEALRFADGSQFEPSPFFRSQRLSRRFGTDLYVLNDASRPTGSFKERGALVAVRDAALNGVLHVVTASHGNHGLAVAMAAQRLGLRSTIVVPDTTPVVKMNRLRELGATVVATGKQPWRGYEEARDWALRYTFERNRYLERTIEAKGVMRYIHGFEDVVPGQGVAAFEILDAIRALPAEEQANLERATFLIPTGGGGLTAGVGTVLRAHLPQAKVLAVVSQEAPALHFSLIEGRRSEVFLNETGLCDSGIGLTIPGARPFELLREVLDGSLAVSDSQVGEALRLIHRHEGLTVEGSAATGIAALLSGKLPQLGVSLEHPIVTILTGRNIDASRHADVLEGREAPWSESSPVKAGD